MKLFGGTFAALENSMNYATEKNRTISNNIANVDTPGYKSKSVVFKEVMNNELSSMKAKRTSPRHLSFQENPSPSYRTITNKDTTYNHNGNNVDMDKEMNELAKNQIYYQALVDRLNGKFRTLENVIKGGS